MHELPEIKPPVRYRDEVVADLGRLGVVPRPMTQPRLIYGFLRALMTFEIRERKLRRRELEQVFGPQPLSDYKAEIEKLRDKYHLLRWLPRHWVE
ncbi:MAG: hypothetical protein GY769_06350 [bacterium]|nr:hypothetical protein [bacterium]